MNKDDLLKELISLEIKEVPDKAFTDETIKKIGLQDRGIPVPAFTAPSYLVFSIALFSTAIMTIPLFGLVSSMLAPEIAGPILLIREQLTVILISPVSLGILFAFILLSTLDRFLKRIWHIPEPEGLNP